MKVFYHFVETYKRNKTLFYSNEKYIDVGYS